MEATLLHPRSHRSSLLQSIENRLASLRSLDRQRNLLQLQGLEDFCSNDYLGLAQRSGHSEVVARVGSGGSRLVSGNDQIHEHFEDYLADFHQGESALVFNSGYSANLGVLSCLLQKTDTIIYDKLCHASIRDGLRLSPARSFGFRHNDLEDLETKLRIAKGTVLVVVESLYSMDGDFCPLKQVCQLAAHYGADVMLDEAHTTGLWGSYGEGYAVQEGVSSSIAIRVHTWGKAVGHHGACVIASPVIRDWLISCCRPLVYTTALSPSHLESVLFNYQKLKSSRLQRISLTHNISYARELLCQKFGNRVLGDPRSPILGLLVPGDHNVMTAAKDCRNRGYAVVGIRSPTVPQGQERLRICIHSFNSYAAITGLIGVLEDVVGD
jgi:8-amino-7-oxononanoate synthase